MKRIYNELIKKKLSNQIIFVVAVICILQIAAVFLVYVYSYQERKEEVIENNIQILHQANSNYFSEIIEELSKASKELFYDKTFWNNEGWESAESYNQIYNIMRSQYNSGNNIDSIYLFSSAVDKVYVMDEVSFNNIPAKTTENTLYIYK